ncbi:DUF6678 family protein (plasmid) [Agrobacterium sp. rho-13.3]|uniref:DUF6678 family protein n=1 Tax=Agrobacterium sp. rho-13.3 TaxID=3072980 RepID=UPI003D793EF7
MNDTKWRKLCAGIADLPFPPGYQVKILNTSPYPSEFEYSPAYFGDWGGTPEARMGLHIEWIKIAPRFERHIGALISPAIDDCADELRALLRRVRCQFVERDGYFTVYGHATGISFD